MSSVLVFTFIVLLVAIVIAFKLPISKPEDSPIARHESDNDHNFGEVVKHPAVHVMFNVDDNAEKSHPLPYDTTGLTYDYWG